MTSWVAEELAPWGTRRGFQRGLRGLDTFRGMRASRKGDFFRGQLPPEPPAALLSGHINSRVDSWGLIWRHLGQLWAALLNSEVWLGGAYAHGPLQGAMGRQQTPRF